jgi:PKD repeat protein
LSYLGRAFYATFGLEGMEVVTVTDELTTTSPVELLGAVFDWTESEPGTATITDITPVTTTAITLFSAEYITTTATPADAEAIAWRWDFGDGSNYVTTNTPFAGHTYACSDDNVYTVRVEIIDNSGNNVIGSQEVDVTNSCFEEERGFFLPFVPNGQAAGQ